VGCPCHLADAARKGPKMNSPEEQILSDVGHREAQLQVRWRAYPTGVWRLSCVSLFVPKTVKQALARKFAEVRSKVFIVPPRPGYHEPL